MLILISIWFNCLILEIEARDEWLNLLKNYSGLPWEDVLFFDIAEALVEGCCTVTNLLLLLNLIPDPSSARGSLEKRLNESTHLNNLVKDGKIEKDDFIDAKEFVCSFILIRSQSGIFYNFK